MASADLSEELECPVCLAIYTDPVTLRCGHNFCRVCIDRVLDLQKRSGGYSCPECREEYKERPGLQTNIALRNIAERFLKKVIVRCTYCVDSPVPAVMSCLHCDASLCDKHLRVHSKAPEHVLCAPTTSPETRKCSVHKKNLQDYSTEDASCVTVSYTVTDGKVIRQLEIKKEELSMKMRHIEELCHMTDRLTVLQESDTGGDIHGATPDKSLIRRAAEPAQETAVTERQKTANHFHTKTDV
ncbi:E3 ubiquitin-protein ligase TRIM8-like [Hyperolius riggenbachi]|uniref:E3 ubiquitin-protein ligase TRIM8-like n=1 Tax=Hyperolius riggenbachi TaxID=752182 RepID=UPI0035A35301